MVETKNFKNFQNNALDNMNASYCRHKRGKAFRDGKINKIIFDVQTHNMRIIIYYHRNVSLINQSNKVHVHWVKRHSRGEGVQTEK